MSREFFETIFPVTSLCTRRGRRGNFQPFDENCAKIELFNFVSRLVMWGTKRSVLIP